MENPEVHELTIADIEPSTSSTPHDYLAISVLQIVG